MSLHDTIRSTIGVLVGGRYYPTKFPQEPAAPTWPAIRGTIVGRENFPDACGAGDHDTDNIRLQLDFCALDYDQADALATSAAVLLDALTPPCVRQPGGFDAWDAEARVHRITGEWLYQPSTGDDLAAAVPP